MMMMMMMMIGSAWCSSPSQCPASTKRSAKPSSTMTTSSPWWAPSAPCSTARVRDKEFILYVETDICTSYFNNFILCSTRVNLKYLCCIIVSGSRSAVLRGADGPEQLPRVDVAGDAGAELAGGHAAPHPALLPEPGLGGLRGLGVGHLLHLPRHLLHPASSHHTGG